MIRNCDCLEGLKELEGASIEVCVTDPPSRDWRWLMIRCVAVNAKRTPVGDNIA